VKRPRSRARPARAKAGRRTSRRQGTRRSRQAGAIEIRQIEALQRELARAATSARPPRWNADPDDVRRSVIKLVLTLVEFIRRILERQAIRRVEAGTLTAEQIEAIGMALMRLEETVRDLGAEFDLTPEDLNLDLGPVGKLI
jgi:hypothetical protein